MDDTAGLRLRCRPGRKLMRPEMRCQVERIDGIVHEHPRRLVVDQIVGGDVDVAPAHPLADSRSFALAQDSVGGFAVSLERVARRDGRGSDDARRKRGLVEMFGILDPLVDDPTNGGRAIPDVHKEQDVDPRRLHHRPLAARYLGQPVVAVNLPAQPVNSLIG